MSSRIPLWTRTVAILLGAALLGGCWNRRELDTLAIVAGLGLDRDVETGKIQLTAQIIKPGEVKTVKVGGAGGGGGGGGKASAVWVIKSTGDTVFDAVRNMVTQSSRKLYFAHNQIIVIGKKTAEQGVWPLLDFFVRDHEIRWTIWVLVADGKASDVLEATPD